MSRRCRRYRGVLIGGAGPRFMGTPHLFTAEGYLQLSASTMAMIAAMVAQSKPADASREKVRREMLRTLVLDGGKAAKALPPYRQDQLLEELAAFGRQCRTRTRRKEEACG